VVVAPTDASIFSAQAFAFGESNQTSDAALLWRSLPDGGGNSFYDLTPTGGPTTRGWIDVIGDQLDPDLPFGTARFSTTSGGVEGGADVAIGPARLGAALAYESSHYSDNAGGRGNQNLVRGSLYGSVTLGSVGFSADLSYAHGSESNARASGLGVSSSSRGVSEVSGAFQAAAPFDVGPLRLTPMAGVLISDISAPAFAEHNGANAAFAVTGAASRGTFVSPYATLALSRSFTTASGAVVTPDAEVGYRHDALAAGLSQSLVAADGTVFAGNRIGLDRNSALVGASLTAHKGPLTVFVRYRAAFASNWRDNSINVGLRVAF
jgi:outer membrane autotransporter protein